MSESGVNEVIENIVSKVEEIQNESSQLVTDVKEVVVEVAVEVSDVIKQNISDIIKEGIVNVKETVLEDIPINDKIESIQNLLDQLNDKTPNNGPPKVVCESESIKINCNSTCVIC